MDVGSVCMACQQICWHAPERKNALPPVTCFLIFCPTQVCHKTNLSVSIGQLSPDQRMTKNTAHIVRRNIRHQAERVCLCVRPALCGVSHPQTHPSSKPAPMRASVPVCHCSPFTSHTSQGLVKESQGEAASQPTGRTTRSLAFFHHLNFPAVAP